MSRELSFLDTCVLIDGLYRDSDHYTAARPFTELAVIEPKAS